MTTTKQRPRGRPKGSTKKANAGLGPATARRSLRTRPTPIVLVQSPTMTSQTTVKRGRGRPKASSATPKTTVNGNSTPKAGRGRPKGSTSLMKQIVSPVATPKSMAPKLAILSRRGRPPGSSKKTLIRRSLFKSRGRPPGSTNKASGEASSAESTTGSAPKNERFSLDRVVGHYSIECHAISAQMAEGLSFDMAMDICNPDDDNRYSASFDFGFLVGTMRLALSEDELATWCDVGAEDDAEAGNEDEADATGSPNAEALSPTIGSKRKESDNVAPTPSKRAKTTSSVAHRVPFRFRARRVGDDTAFGDDSQQTGIMDFPIVNGNAFWGVVNLPGFANGLAFHGVRTWRDTDNQPTPWSAFEEAASDP